MTEAALRELERSFPRLKDVENETELLWLNPKLRSAAEGHRLAPLTMADIEDAEARAAFESAPEIQEIPEEPLPEEPVPEGEEPEISDDALPFPEEETVTAKAADDDLPESTAELILGPEN